MTAHAIQPTAGASNPVPALIVLGRDDSGKPHASWFDKAEAALATQAARLMGMSAVQVATDELRGLAGQLPHGRVFSSGRAFVPFVKGSLYDQLATHAPKPDPKANPKTQPASKPAGGGSVSPAKPEPSQAASYADEKPATGRASASIARDWDAIKVGSLVVAYESDDDGWWIARVSEVKGDGLFVLKWRDFPDMPPVLRKRADMALMHPECTK